MYCSLKHVKRILPALLAAALLGLPACRPDVGSRVQDVVNLGQAAPDFTLQASDGRFLKSSDVKPGWYLVLIFYRGSWCSACENQLLNLKDDYAKFAALHATLAAISVDSVEDSAAFDQQWRFPFPLLADPKLRVIDIFGLRHPKAHMGQDISRPAVIILDPHRTVRFKYVGQNPQDRPTDDEILFSIQQIEKLDRGGFPATATPS